MCVCVCVCVCVSREAMPSSWSKNEEYLSHGGQEAQAAVSCTIHHTRMVEWQPLKIFVVCGCGLTSRGSPNLNVLWYCSNKKCHPQSVPYKEKPKRMNTSLTSSKHHLYCSHKKEPIWTGLTCVRNNQEEASKQESKQEASKQKSIISSLLSPSYMVWYVLTNDGNGKYTSAGVQYGAAYLIIWIARGCHIQIRIVCIYSFLCCIFGETCTKRLHPNRIGS